MRGIYKQMTGVSCHVGRPLSSALIYFSSFLNQKFDILSHSIKCRRAAAHFRLIVNSAIRLGDEMFIYLLFKLYLATFWFPSRFALFLLFTFSSISFNAFLCLCVSELLTECVCVYAVCVCALSAWMWVWIVEVIWKVLFCIAANSNLVSCARPIPVDCFLLQICHSSMDVSCCCRRWHFFLHCLLGISCGRHSILFFHFWLEDVAAVPIASSVRLWTEKLFSFHVNISFFFSLGTNSFWNKTTMQEATK